MEYLIFAIVVILIARIIYLCCLPKEKTLKEYQDELIEEEIWK